MNNAANGTDKPNGGGEKKCGLTPSRPSVLSPMTSLPNNFSSSNKASGGGTVDTSPINRRKGIIDTNQTIPNN